MYDIITFGSGTRDIYLISDDFLVAGEKKFVSRKGICLSLGSKTEVKDILFRTGGGGTNTAVTFKNQGFKVAFCGMVGKDFGGQQIIGELKRKGVDTKFVFQTKEKPTNYSVILTSAGKERTILVYRGASGLLGKKDIPWLRDNPSPVAKWFYLAPLSDKLCNIFEDLVNFAYKNKIKIAVNPGNCQLSLPKVQLKRIFKKIDILILNQEESSLLTKIPYQKDKEIFKKLDNWVDGIVIMTKGVAGAVVSDGKFIYKAKAPRIKVVDRTGAGDSFGSGFVSGFIKKGDISFAIQLAIANSSACLSEWGAKEGLLKEKVIWKKARVEKRKL